MAIDAKISFLSQIEKRLSDKLTMKDMSIVLENISDVLEGYVMYETVKNDDTPDDMLESFISALQIQGRSIKTIERYKYVIKKFTHDINQTARKVNVYHIRNWLAAEKNRGISDSTLEGNRQVLSSYFGWLFRERLIERNPMDNVGAIKVPKKQRDVYSDIDIMKLNRNCKSVLDKAIIGFLSSTGCRISEMTSLDRDSLDLRNRQCVVHGKGNKERIVYFDAVTGLLLTEYLQSRTDSCEALFISRHKQRIQPDGVRFVLKEIAKVAGVEHCHPHKFRRTFATELARHGMPIQNVSRLLGHEKLETTMRYVNTNDEDVKSDYRKYA